MADEKQNAGGFRPLGLFRRAVSIRWSLARNALFLILLITVALIGSNVLTTRQAFRALSRSWIQRTVDVMDLELHQYFRPMQAILRVTGEWVLSGELDVDDPEALRHRLSPLLHRLPQISAFNTGDENGHGYMFLYTGTNWLSREVRWPEWGTRARLRRWEAGGAVAERWWEDLDYDPRRRPWYEGAMRARAEQRDVPPDAALDEYIWWTQPYLFFTRQQPGMTASLALEVPGREAKVVIALDVLLEDLSRFTSRLAPSENGFAFVASEDGALIGRPRGSPDWSPGAETNDLDRALESLGQEAAAVGVRKWEANGKPPFTPFRFESEGTGWWAGFHPIRLGPNRQFWVGVMVPKEDFMADVWRQRTMFLMVMSGALMVAVVMIVFLSRRYSRPLQALVLQSERIRELNLHPHPSIPSRLAEVDLLTRSQESMRRALESFSRYVPVGVVRELVKRGEAAQLGGKTETLTIMFSDIEGFTGIAESMSPEDLTVYLAQYFETIQCALDRYHATIDKFIGDAVLAFWGAPVPESEHALKAIQAVMEADRSLRVFEEKAHQEGRCPFPTRFGLATGSVVVGNIGSPDRLNYSVIGNTVNLASRLEGLNRHYGTRILVSDAVVLAAGESVVWRRVDRVVVKGQQSQVEIFEPLGREGEVDAEVLRMKEVYESALTAFHERRFQEALNRLVTEGGVFQKDPSFRLLASRAREYLTAPPPKDWDTSFKFAEK